MSSMMSGGAGAGAGATSASTGPDWPTSSADATNGASSSSSWSKYTSAAKSMGGIPILGPMLSGVGSIMQGQQEGQADDNRSILYSQQSLLDKYNAGTQVKANEDRAVADISAVGAQSGASGVTTAGSPMEAARQTIARANTADVTARWIGAIHSSSDMYQSELARYAGSQARLSGWINGFSSMGTGGLQAASIF